jgi:protein involved in polysaccharide export with SLBB domain
MLSGRGICCLGVFAACGFVLGCATNQKCLDEALLADRDPAAHGTNLAEQYVVHCPDVVEINVKDHPEWSGVRAVTPDGRIGLTEHAYLRVDGQTTVATAKVLEHLAAAPPGDVGVRVVEYRSQVLYLVGEGPGLQRVVPYQGPETVVDFLQRVGGLSSRCAPGEIQVIRAHVADGGPTEVFHVDLSAILLKHDQRTNITLQSFDQIYIGQSRQSNVLSCCPPWFQPLYKAICGMARREKAAKKAKELLRGDPEKPTTLAAGPDSPL